MNPSDDNDLPKVWLRIPYLGHRGENLINSCLRKIRGYLERRAKFIVIHNTKKMSYFTSNKNKISELSKSNIVYQIFFPSCSKTYIGNIGVEFSIPREAKTESGNAWLHDWRMICC